MAGAIMRLRQDGHDELQIHGPSGYFFSPYTNPTTGTMPLHGSAPMQCTEHDCGQCLQWLLAVWLLTLCVCAGLCANLHGLRHFVQWKHPKVFASEHSEWDAPQVYEVTYALPCHHQFVLLQHGLDVLRLHSLVVPHHVRPLHCVRRPD